MVGNFVTTVTGGAAVRWRSPETPLLSTVHVQQAALEEEDRAHQEDWLFIMKLEANV